MRPPKKGTFEAKLVPAMVRVRDIVRLSRNPAREPYWAGDRRFRFDAPDRSYGVLYAGDSIETSFAESVIHESSLFVAGNYVISERDLAARMAVWYGGKVELRFADLTGQGLKAIGLNNDISAGGDYGMPQRWSKAIHEADISWDGVRFVSRQNNQRFAYAVFERTGLVATRSRALTAREKNDLCETFNVSLLP